MTYHFSLEVQRIAKENDIQIRIATHSKWDGEYVHGGQALTREATNIITKERKIITKEIVINPKLVQKSIVIWHELGHLMHPKGNKQGLLLDSELAANEWALQNYQGCVPLPHILHNMRVAILTYVEGGHYRAHREFEHVALALDVHDRIRFVD